MTRTGWTSLAVFALCVTISIAQVITPDVGGIWWWLRVIAVGVFATMTVRCTIAAAHAPERKYTR